ncbi:MAG: peptidoglycan/LPS O-acetylase OafA/YrhL [Marinobacter psychrophilus]|jgi:peptidoglycan/LPS O-acetylase OafA/YrhL
MAGRLNWLANGPLLWLGGLSYSLYLIHQNIGYGVISWSYNADMPGWFGVCLALGIVLLFAWLSHYSVEKTALRRFRAWHSQTRANTGRAVTATKTYV